MAQTDFEIDNPTTYIFIRGPLQFKVAAQRRGSDLRTFACDTRTASAAGTVQTKKERRISKNRESCRFMSRIRALPRGASRVFEVTTSFA